MQKRIELLEEYIKLLKDELDELATVATVHGWKSSRVEQGKILREQMASLPKEIAEQGEQRMSAEEILLNKFPLLPKSSNKEGMGLIIEAMQEYAQEYHEEQLRQIDKAEIDAIEEEEYNEIHDDIIESRRTGEIE